jgi:hypothetical protein
MDRLFRWFLPRFTPTLERPLNKPVERLGLTEASQYAKTHKGVVYRPVSPSSGK